MADVKHTPELWYVRPAWTQGRDGNERRCGWHLMSGNAWAQTFARKRDAQAEAARQNALFAATEAAIAKATGAARATEGGV